MYDIQKTYNPESLQEVFAIFGQEKNAIPAAGGTDVFIRLKSRKLKAATLVNIREIPSLRGIQKTAEGIRIGAATPFAEIADSGLLRESVPVLAEACRQVGSPQIRQMGTIGGNLCNGAVSADSVPALLALDAELLLASKQGERRVPVCRFHTGPGKTVLRAGEEILTAIFIPGDHTAGWTGCYLKFGQRNAMEIATLGCAACVKLSRDKQTLEKLCIAFGVAAPVPARCPRLEQQVAGMPVGRDLLEVIDANALSELSPRNSWRASLAFRRQLIKTLSVRAVSEAIRRQGGEALV